LTLKEFSTTKKDATRRLPKMPTSKFLMPDDEEVEQKLSSMK